MPRTDREAGDDGHADVELQAPRCDRQRASHQRERVHHPYRVSLAQSQSHEAVRGVIAAAL
jgi:hypothetical protein